MMQTDLHCICAQVADILADPIARQDFLKAQDDQAQQLLDLLQDVSMFIEKYLCRTYSATAFGLPAPR